MDNPPQVSSIENTAISETNDISHQSNSRKRLLIIAGIIVTFLLIGAGVGSYYLNTSKDTSVQTKDNDISPTTIEKQIETKNGFMVTNINNFDIPFNDISITELFDISKSYTIPQSKLNVQQDDLIQISCSGNYFLNESNEPVIRDDSVEGIVIRDGDIKEMFTLLSRDFPKAGLDIPFDSPHLIVCKTEDNKYFGRFDSYYSKSLPFFLFDQEFNLKWIIPKSDQNISKINNKKDVLGDVPKLCNYMLGLTANNDLYYMCAGSDAQYASMNLYVINLDTSLLRFIIHCSSQGDGKFENPKSTTTCTDREV